MYTFVRLFPFVKQFVTDHMGVEKLNVADTIAAIMQDNPTLCSTVSESFLRSFLDAIKVWGRRARWLSFFTVFIVQKGRAMKRNQDLVLRLLFDEKEALLDLSCDYTASPYLSKADERSGMSRVDLMIAEDHKRTVFSLLKYHITTLSLLAMLCWGKNGQSMNKITQEIPLKVIMQGILDSDMRSEGSRDPRVRADAVRYVQTGWLQLLTDAYLNNPDSVAVAEVQAERRIIGTAACLIQGISACMDSLNQRLKVLDSMNYAATPELLQDVVDTQGDGLYIHYMCVTEMVRTAQAFFSKYDVFIEESTEEITSLSTSLRNSTVTLYATVGRLRYSKLSESMVELITCLTSRGIEGLRLDLIIDGSPPEKKSSEQRCFQEGFKRFCKYASYMMGVDPTEGREMDEAIKDIALLFGSAASHENGHFQSLKELLTVLKDKDCDPSIKIIGLKILRAILYMVPDDPHISFDHQTTEYERLRANLPPTRLTNPEFLLMQGRLASLGGVELVSACIIDNNDETVMATLHLAIAMLEGGNTRVQNLFAKALLPASSEPFFRKLGLLFRESVDAIKEQKRKVKQLVAEKAALHSAGKA